MKLFISDHSGKRRFERPDSQAWARFFDELLFHGYEIVKNVEEAEVYIALGHSPKFIRKTKKITKARKVLAIFEPRCVRSGNYVERNRKKYGKVFVASKNWIMSSSDEIFPWPQTNIDLDIVTTKSGNSRINRFVFIQRNNVSLIDGELYSLRRGILKQIDSHIDIYGHGWNRSRASSFVEILRAITRISPSMIYSFKLNGLADCFTRFPDSKGIVANKLNTLQEYKFSIIIENSKDYVSEKLIDAVIAGTIPLYVGPNLVEHDYPNTIAIQADTNFESIDNKMREILQDPDRQDEILKSGKEFLVSEQYLSKVNTKVLGNLASSISSYLKGAN